MNYKNKNQTFINRKQKPQTEIEIERPIPSFDGQTILKAQNQEKPTTKPNP